MLADVSGDLAQDLAALTWGTITPRLEGVARAPDRTVDVGLRSVGHMRDGRAGCWLFDAECGGAAIIQKLPAHEQAGHSERRMRLILDILKHCYSSHVAINRKCRTGLRSGAPVSDGQSVVRHSFR
ncbi:hypothetical protein D9M70_601520 [compost metagenome]